MRYGVVTTSAIIAAIVAAIITFAQYLQGDLNDQEPERHDLLLVNYCGIDKNASEENPDGDRISKTIIERVGSEDVYIQGTMSVPKES